MPSSTRPPAVVAAPAVNHEAAKRGEPPSQGCAWAARRCCIRAGAGALVSLQAPPGWSPPPRKQPALTLPCPPAEAVAAQLASEFPEFDAALIGELLAQEDGDDGEGGQRGGQEVLLFPGLPRLLLLVAQRRPGWDGGATVAVADETRRPSAVACQPDRRSLPRLPPPPAAAVKYCLRKMRNQAAAEEKKRQRQAKLDAGKGGEEPAAAEGEGSQKASGGAAKGKRARSRSAGAEVEAEGAAAKKVKA